MTLPRPILLAALLLGALSLASHADPRTLWSQGQSAYRQGDFQSSADAFTALRDLLATTGTLDRAAADLNRGNALFRLASYPEALDAFTHAVRTSDLQLQARAWHNHGRTLIALAEADLREGHAAQADQRYAEAMTSFRRSLRLHPENHDAKINFEWAARERIRLRGLVLQFMQVIDDADARIAQRDYLSAYQILTQPDPARDFALNLQPDLKPAFEQRVQHTGELLGMIQEVAQFLEQFQTEDPQ